MNWRLFSLGLLCLLGLVVDLALVGSEQIVEGDATRVTEEQADVLFGMRFAPDQRETNLRAMGLDPAEIDDTRARIATLEKKYRIDDPVTNLFLARFDSSPDKDGLTEALCGTGARSASSSTLPVRYEALRYLVSNDSGPLRALRLDEAATVELQEWSASARLDAVFRSAELTRDRAGDATRMAVAAVLAGPQGEQDLLERRRGWGNSFWSPWSWARVQQDHPGLRDRLLDYLALMHLAAEQAGGERGLCGR